MFIRPLLLLVLSYKSFSLTDHRSELFILMKLGTSSKVFNKFTGILWKELSLRAHRLMLLQGDVLSIYNA